MGRKVPATRSTTAARKAPRKRVQVKPASELPSEPGHKIVGDVVGGNGDIARDASTCELPKCLLPPGTPIRTKKPSGAGKDWQAQTGHVMPYDYRHPDQKDFPVTLGGRWRLASTKEVEAIEPPKRLADITPKLREQKPNTAADPGDHTNGGDTAVSDAVA